MGRAQNGHRAGRGMLSSGEGYQRPGRRRVLPLEEHSRRQLYLSLDSCNNILSRARSSLMESTDGLADSFVHHRAPCCSRELMCCSLSGQAFFPRLAYCTFSQRHQHAHSPHAPHFFHSDPSGGFTSTGPLPTSAQFVLSAVPPLSE